MLGGMNSTLEVHQQPHFGWNKEPEVAKNQKAHDVAKPEPCGTTKLFKISWENRGAREPAQHKPFYFCSNIILLGDQYTTIS